MDEDHSENKGVRLLKKGQSEELHFKWRIWLERKLASATNLEDILKWKQLLESSFPLHEKDVYADADTEDEDEDVVLSEDEIDSKSVTFNSSEEHLEEEIEDIENMMTHRELGQDLVFNTDAKRDSHEEQPLRRCFCGGEHLQRSLPDIPSFLAEQYKEQWDEISDFPNLFSVAFSSNNENNKSTEKLTESLKDSKDKKEYCRHYCPYPPKIRKPKPHTDETSNKQSVENDEHNIQFPENNFFKNMQHCPNCLRNFTPDNSRQFKRHPSQTELVQPNTAINYESPAQQGQNFLKCNPDTDFIPTGILKISRFYPTKEPDKINGCISFKESEPLKPTLVHYGTRWASSSDISSVSSISRKSNKRGSNKRNVIIILLVALILLASLALIIGISLFFTKKTQILRAHISLVIDNKNFSDILTDTSSKEFRDISKPLCSEMYKYFWFSKLKSYFNSCDVQKMTDSDGKIGVNFDLNFHMNNEMDRGKTIEEIIVEKSPKLVKDEKLFLMIREFLVYVKSINVVVETVDKEDNIYIPVDGFWQEWSEWSVCSTTCGDGVHLRNRSCVEPLHGGDTCVGDNKNEIKPCTNGPCLRKPSFSKYMIPFMEIKEGQSGMLKLAAEGNALTYKLLKNGDNVDSPNVNIKNGILQMVNMDREFAGTYTLIAENTEGSAYHNFTVNVIYKPSFNENTPDTLEILEGQSRTFNFSANGGKLKYTLYKDDGSILSTNTLVTDGVVHITNIDRSNAGLYSLKAENSEGSTFHNFTLKVVHKPVFGADTVKSIEVIEGQNQTLNISVSGERLVYTLYKDDKKAILPNNIFADGSVHLLNIDRTDAGIYALKAENSEGATFHNFSVKVIHKPVFDTTTMQHIDITEGHDGTLNFSARGERLVYTLYKDGKQSSPSNIRLSDGIIQLSYIDRTNAGTYALKAENSEGSTFLNFTVKVIHKPVFGADTVKSIEVIEGQNQTLNISVSGERLVYTLYKDDKKAILPNNIFADGSVHLLNIDRTDAGIYALKAENSEGATFHNFSVKVIHKPVFDTTTMQHIDITEGHDGTLNFSARGERLVYTLYKDGKQSSPSNIRLSDGIIQLSYIDRTNAGTYALKAENSEGSTFLNFTVKVIHKPVFDESTMQHIEISEGNNRTLNFYASGERLVYTLYKDGQQSSPSNIRVSDGIVQLNHIDRTNAGTYALKAENSEGSTFHNFTVTVIHKPVFNENVTHDIEIVERYNKTLKLNVSGERVVFTLYKGENLFNSTHIRVADGDIQLIYIDRTNAGTYKIEAKNSEGSTFHTFNIKVIHKPVFNEVEAQSIEIVEGQNHTLNLNVSGERLQFTLYKDGKLFNLSQITVADRILNITNIDRTDAGSYAVKADNSEGSTFLNFTVKVIHKPVFITRNDTERHIFIAERHNRTLNLNVTGERLIYTLYKDGKNINSSKISITDGTLNMHNIDRTDAGTYGIKAENSEGSTFHNVTVKVIHKPVFNIDNTEQQIMIVERQNRTINFNVSGERLVYTINKDGENINSSQITIKDGGLAFTNIDRTDAGTYELKAENSEGSTFHYFTVKVMHKPVFTTSNDMEQHIFIAERHNRTIDLNVTGEQLIYALYKDGENINSSQIRIADERLTLNNIDRTDAGTYAVKAENAEGSTFHNITVTVIHKPVFTTNTHIKQQLLISEGQNRAINLNTTGERLVYTIYKDEENITSSQISIADGILTFTNIDRIDAGTYAIKAENSEGSTFHNITLKVIHKPVFTSSNDMEQHILIVERQNQTVNLNVTGERLVFTIYKDGENINSSQISITDGILTLTNIDRTDAGMYLIKAENSEGSTFHNVTVKVLHKPVFKTSDDMEQQILIVEGQNRTMILNVTGERLVYTIYKDGINKSQISITDGILTFTNIDRTDAGTYAIKAENSEGSTFHNVTVKVIHKPVFTTTDDMEQQILIVEGQNRTMNLNVTGERLVYTLYKHGNNINSSQIRITERILTLTNVDRTDAGTYTVKAENSEGSTFHNITLKVIHKPVFATNNDMEQRIWIVERQNLTIDLNVTGEKLVYTIYKDGKNISSSHIMITDGILTLTNMDRTDAGMYTIKAENSEGSTLHNVTVNVIHTPVFTTSNDIEQQILIVERQNRTITLNATGERLIYTLYKDGENINSFKTKITDGILTLTNIDRIDAGTYTIKAENSEGSTFHNVTVKVIHKPVFITTNDMEQNILIVERHNRTINLNVTGEKLIYTLYKVRGNINSSQISITDGKLILTNIDRTDTGTYTIKAENSEGSTFHNVTVKVIHKPVFARSNDMEQQILIVERQNQTINLNVTGERLVYNIYKDGKNINSSQILITDGRLILTDIDRTDAGTFAIKAENSEGSTFHNVTVKVIHKPVFTESNDMQQHILIVEGQNQTVNLNVTGEKLVFTIYKDGENTNSSQISITDGILTLTNIDRTDAGTYAIKAENSEGSTFHNVTVKVIHKPVFSENVAQNIEIIEGQNLSLNLNVSGERLGFTLYKDGEAFNSSHIILTDGMLHLINIERNDAGTFGLTAENSEGSTRLNITIKVIHKPVFSESVEKMKVIEITEGHNMTLNLNVSGGGIMYTLYKDEEMINSSRIRVFDEGLHLTDIDRTHAGTYILKAENSEGSTFHNFTIKVIHKPVYPENIIQTIEISEGQNRTLKLNVSGEQLVFTLYKDGEKVSTSHISVDDGVLKLTNIDRTNSGTYVLKAQNSEGSTLHNLTINVIHKPVFTENEIQEIEIVEGHDRTVSLNVSGERLVFTLSKDGKKVNSSQISVNDGIMSLTGIDRTNGGTYQIEAVNSEGSTLHNLTVNVIHKPVFSENLMEEIEIVEGQNQILNLDVSGERLVFTLYKDGVEINSPHFSVNDGVLDIIDINRTHAGTYQIEAENSEGSTFYNVTVKVIHKPLFSYHLIEHIEISEGQNRTLNLNVSGERLVFTLYKDKMEINSTHVCVSDGILNLIDIDRIHAGTYGLMAVNSEGSTFYNFTVKVIHKPVFSENIVQNIEIPEGHDQTLNLNVSGERLLFIIYKDGVEINSSHISVDDGILKLTDVHRIHAGTYKIRAENSEGATFYNFTVKVIHKPLFSDDSVHAIEIVEGHNQTINLNVSGENLVFTLLKDGNAFNSSHVSITDDRLTLTNINRTNAGNYSLKAENSEGITFHTFTVKVIHKPIFSENGIQSVLIGEGQNRTLNLDVSGENIVLTLLKDNENFNSTRIVVSDGMIKLIDVDRAHSGNYILKAENSEGSTFYNLTLKVQVDGNWTDWTPWSDCSVTCGGGIMLRNRSCSNPEPQYGGLNCTGAHTEDIECNINPCPIDGNWTDWSLWSDCSISCGGGIMTRNRSCVNPEPQYGGLNCSGNHTENIECSTHHCPIDGNWTEWTSWSDCSVTCGGGTTTRNRSCSNPEPQYGGLNCTGNYTENFICNQIHCPIDGNWTNWTAWSDCTVTCGGGIMMRNRSCSNPEPQYGGTNCTGHTEEDAGCNTHQCPINGNWTDWTSWSDCSVTCGGGVMTRNRSCSNPEPQYGGINCTGNQTDDSACNTDHCPIDGNWTDWTSWSDCSVTCGGGVMIRKRSCSNPEPQYGGLNCTGNLTEDAGCNTNYCPIDGNWTEWASWSDCSVTCGGGVMVRNRSCSNPEPQYGGLNCDGNHTDDAICNTNHCPINGNWTDWTPWSDCSVTCGGGSMVRNRSCSNPEPQYGGFNCTGKYTEDDACNTDHCPINGSWTNWTQWSDCSVSCGGGVMVRNRSCSNPLPQYGGLYCTGNQTEDVACNINHCPINGNWTEWTSWSDCSVTCGGGVMTRNRSCSNPEPQYEGLNCTGTNTENLTCNTNNCPIDGNWTPWTPWSVCSVTCGGGIMLRNRRCSNPEPQYGGVDCIGNLTDENACNTNNCPVNGNWTEWSPWSACSVTCGGGFTTRNRSCSNPEPQYGGLNCIGNHTEDVVCNTYHCPVNGDWTDWTSWSDCSVTCGGGIMMRNRSCSNPEPQYNGSDCIGKNTEESICNKNNCPIDGNWTNWTSWSDCSVTCGGGVMTRNRSCSNPKPQYGGFNCHGNKMEDTRCNTDHCPIDGSWTQWTSWSECSVTCGDGDVHRTRNCSNPLPNYGGKPCTGKARETKKCNNGPCKVHGNWSDWQSWSACTVSCGGGGVQQRKRQCDNPTPKYEGDPCIGIDVEVQVCGEVGCPGLAFKSVEGFEGADNIVVTCHIENFTSWKELLIAKNSGEAVKLSSNGVISSDVRKGISVTTNLLKTHADLRMAFDTLDCKDEGTYTCSVDQGYQTEAEVIVKTAPTKNPHFDISTEIFGERSVHFTCSGDPGYPYGHFEFWIKFRNGTEYEEYRFHSVTRTVTDKGCEREELVAVDFLFPMRWNGAKIRCTAPDSKYYTEKEIWLISEFYCDSVPLYTTVKHPYTCKKYMRCMEDKVDVMECPSGLCYNEDLQQCVYQ